jgi:hypothetical protein
MDYSSRRHYAETLSLRSRDHFRPRHISARKLVSAIDLGWSDNRIACYFGVEPVKVSALRAYYGLVDRAKDSWVWRMRRRHRLESDGMSVIGANADTGATRLCEPTATGRVPQG